MRSIINRNSRQHKKKIVADSLPRTALAVVLWVQKHAVRVEFQEADPKERQKNRVILIYRSPFAAEPQAVGGVNLPQAVFKAAVRLRDETARRQADWQEAVNRRNAAVAEQRTELGKKAA